MTFIVPFQLNSSTSLQFLRRRSSCAHSPTPCQLLLDCLADGKRISQPGRGTRIKSSEGRPQDLVALLLGLPPFPHQQTAQQRLPQ